MKAKYKIILSVLMLIAATALTTFYVYTHDIEVLNPKGLIGLKERELIVTASLLMLIVVIPVFAFTIYFSWKYRASNEKARHEPDWEHNSIAEMCWWGVPFLILMILAVITWRSTHDLNPFKPLESNKKPIVIQAVALDWKWLFIYPEHGIATVNHIEFPEKTPLNFEITADAPMNSFWIPQLGGQIYAMPAMRSKIHLIANEKGLFKGRSSNYSGKGFAGMKFTAKATSDEEFEEWVSSVRRSPKNLGLSEYENLVKPSSYDQPSYYKLGHDQLFDWILEKYAPPKAASQ